MVAAPQYLAGLHWLCTDGDVVRYFLTDGWKLHCEKTEKQRTSDPVALRVKLAEMVRWFDAYAPGGKTPEDT